MFYSGLADENEYVMSGNGLIVPGRLAKRPTVIDLFCGCGGFSLGMMKAGFEVVAAVDWDPLAVITYMMNLGNYPCQMHFIEPDDQERMVKALSRHLGFNKKEGITMAITSGSGWIKHNPDVPPVRNVWVGDVRKLKGEDILNALGMEPGQVDCVCGGPPCQGFSTAGKRDVMDPRNSLIFDFARLVLEIQPKTIAMENVPGIVDMVTPEGIPVMDAFCRVLEDGGFGTLESLKKSLLNTAGQGAALRGRGKTKSEANRKEYEQPSLFSVKKGDEIYANQDQKSQAHQGR